MELKNPGGHDWHAVTLAASLNEPIGQSVHTLAEGNGLNVPGWHAMQDVASE